MNIELLVVGKTDSSDMERLFVDYARRINHYCKFSLTTLPDIRGVKSMTPKQVKAAEAEAILKQLTTSDYVVLLDERGTEYRSVDFAAWLQKRLSSGVKRLVIVVGGAWGFGDAVYGRADGLIALSKMTFTHQFVRVVFAEQIYRAFTILRNEPYHNE